MSSKIVTDISVYKQVATDLRELLATNAAPVEFHTIFHSKVKLYKKLPDGSLFINMGARSIALVVVCAVAEQWQYLNGLNFLLCAIDDANGTMGVSKIWICPLIPSISKYYCTNLGSFMLSDLECQIPGVNFGLVLIATHEEPLEELQQLFQELLEISLEGTADAIRDLIMKQPQQQEQQQQQNELETTAQTIAENMIKGATLGRQVLQKSSYIANMLPISSVIGAVSKTVHGTVGAVKTVGGAARGATGWLTGTVGSMLGTAALSGALVPHVETVGTAVLQRSLGIDKNTANSAINLAVKVAGSAATIYSGIDASARILALQTAKNSFESDNFTVSDNRNYLMPDHLLQPLINETGRSFVQQYRKYKHKI